MQRSFQERARRLHRSPRPQAWQRLERRLDERARRRRLGWYRLGGIAAAVLIMVGLTWTLSQSAYEQAPREQAMAVLHDTPAQATAPTWGPLDAQAADRYRRRARLHAASPIDEGRRDQQLVVVAPDGRKVLPTIAPAPERTQLEQVSRLRVRPDAEWRAE